MIRPSNKCEIRRFYNSIANDYGGRFQGLAGRYYHDVEEECILKLTDFSNKTVLDMGTGNGRIAFSLSGKLRAERVVGIDIADRFLDIAHNTAPMGNVAFCVMDAEETAFQDSVFDVVVVVGLFEYVEDLSEYVKEISRILKPDGELIFSCWNRNRWFGWRIFDDRMKGSVDHSLRELSDILKLGYFHLTSSMTTFFIPTKLFFRLYDRLTLHTFIQKLYVQFIIAIERGLRKLPSNHKGGELIVKARKRIFAQN
jgi:phosphatidylethanolamine/phosphatidyl-N-methylethanolamine N-methyltransferase